MIMMIMLFSSSISLFNPLVIKFLIDNVLIDWKPALLKWVAIILILVNVLEGTIFMATSYSSTLLGQRLLLDIRKMLFEHIEHMSPSFFFKNKSGDIIQRLYNDSSQIQSLLSTRIIEILKNIITAVGAIVLLLLLNQKLTFITILVFPLFAATTFYFSKKIRAREKIVSEKSGEMLSFFQEIIALIPLVQSFVKEKYEARRHLRKSREVIDISLNGSLLYSSSGFVQSLLVSSTTAIIYWAGGNAFFEGTLTLGGLIAYASYVSKLFGPISELVRQNLGIQAALVSLERVFEFLDVAPEVKDSAHARALKKVKGEIVFESVNFSYDGKFNSLDNISFKVKPGEAIALVGESGSGKSTVGNLLLRFYDPQKGCIRLDGTDIKDIKLSSLREYIGIVSQDVTLFNTSILENIRYGRRGASDDDVITAAHLANMGEFIEERLPEKFDTVVGERGAKLSGGQKQRISVARVILKNPRVLILDEATSALDTESEKIVQTVLEYFMKGRTTFIIAHRFSTIKNVDRVIVLDDGAIAEIGKHDELYNAPGIYRQLYDNQFQNESHAVERYLSRQYRDMKGP
jgi:ABC-type multidrug transport system fused ATPase/permease subunit